MRRQIQIAVCLNLSGFALMAADAETESKFPLLARLDIPVALLPEGCAKPEIKDGRFPIPGLRQCAVTTDARAIAALDERVTKVGSMKTSGLYFGVYREKGELGVTAWAFATENVARDAHHNVVKAARFFKTWRRGRHVVALWRDKGATDGCMREMAAVIERIVEGWTEGDGSAQVLRPFPKRLPKRV